MSHNNNDLVINVFRYLEGDQLTSASSVNRYRIVILTIVFVYSQYLVSPPDILMTFVTAVGVSNLIAGTAIKASLLSITDLL